MKKLMMIILLGAAVNAYSQSIFNGYDYSFFMNLGMWIDGSERETINLFGMDLSGINLLLSGDFTLVTAEYLGDLSLGMELRTYVPDDIKSYDDCAGRILEVGGRLLYGYNLGTDNLSVYPYGGLTLGYLWGSDRTVTVQQGGSTTTYTDGGTIGLEWNRSAIFGTRLLWNGWGAYAEYVFNLDSRKSFLTVGFTTGDKGFRYTPFTPAPRYEPTPAPQPTPPPTPRPVAPPQAGTIYYQYDGTGYVYVNNNVFYLCSNGRPVGYLEGDTIYAFSGMVLGFYAHPFIHDIQGNAVGSDDPKKLGTDAAAKRQVSKAPQQEAPTKSPKQPVNKPRLKNGYFGGSLRDIF